MVEVMNRIEETINAVKTLQEYLTANTEFLPSEKPVMPDEPQYTKIKITVINSAPKDTSQKIVFTGVGLSIAKLGGELSTVAPEQINFKLHKNDNTQANTSVTQSERSVQILQKINYVHMNGTDFPDVTKDETRLGEYLFPGESMYYEMDVPNDDLPYYQFRLEGTVSYRHLFHHEVILPIAEAYTRPIVLTALRNFNNLDIHKVLKSILISMPEFGNDTKLSEIRRYIGILSVGDDDVDTLQKSVNDLYRLHKFTVFQAHMQSVYNYLGHIKGAIENLRLAISSSIPETITSEINKLQAMNEEAILIDKQTESLMTRFNLSDADVDYKYRHW
jgi:hypothetical protein